MQVKDIMTKNVVTIAPGTSIEEIAKLLLEHKISGVPVVDSKGTILGIVSEGDLLRQLMGSVGHHHSWWLEMLTGSRERAEEYVKDHGLQADDVMTRDVLTVGEQTSVAEVARILEERRIKRVPVVDGGKLLGVVSRANLLHCLAVRKETAPAPSADDRIIREQIMAALEKEEWVSHGSLNVIVNDGVVDLWGWVESEEERRALMILVENISGVHDVQDHLGSVPPYLQGT